MCSFDLYGYNMCFPHYKLFVVVGYFVVVPVAVLAIALILTVFHPALL